jgi:hypothetical protein
VDDAGSFIAGLIEAGLLHDRRDERRAVDELQVQLTMRDDDLPLLNWVRDTTGLGTIYPRAACGRSKPQVMWIIHRRQECAQLAELLEEHPLLGRKDTESLVWRHGTGQARRKEMRGLRDALVDIKGYRPPIEWLPSVATDLAGHLSGYLV